MSWSVNAIGKPKAVAENDLSIRIAPIYGFVE